MPDIGYANYPVLANSNSPVPPISQSLPNSTSLFFDAGGLPGIVERRSI